MAIHPQIIYRGNYTVGTYNIDSQRRLTIPALTQMMHEAAMQNVLDLKLSYWDLIPHKISWVIMRKRMEIFRHPMLGETITIETHPAGFEKLFTYRDFKVFDEKGECIAQASSTWLLMDTEKRKMTPIPSFIREFEMPDIPFLDHPIKKIPSITQADFQQKHQVGWFELDWNEHLNNIHYLQKMLNNLPLEVHKSKTLKRLDIIYKMECKYGDSLLVETQENLDDNPSFLHRIINSETGKEVALGRSFWE